MTIEDLVKGTFLEDIFKFASERNFGESGDRSSPSNCGEGDCEEFNKGVYKLRPLERVCDQYINSKRGEIENMLRAGISLEDEKVQKALGLFYGAINFFNQLMSDGQFVFIDLRNPGTQWGTSESETIH